MVLPPEILDHYKISELARICRVTVKTARNWKDGKTFPPATALMVLQRDLGCFDPAWAGWVISRRGELCSPENWVATQGDVRSVQLVQLQLGDYRREIQMLKAELNAIAIPDEQPLPGDWEIEIKTG